MNLSEFGYKMKANKTTFKHQNSGHFNSLTWTLFFTNK